MAHEISIRQTGFAEMAFAGNEKPWHGLGQNVPEGADIETWRKLAGLDWDINRSTVQFMNGSMHNYEDFRVLYRSDSNEPLSVVGKNYKVVQPKEVLEFFRDLVSQDGFTIETAGSLKGGRRIWALAKTNLDGEIVDGDLFKTYLLLVTSCDGGLATTAQFTSVRVVCNNTLQMSLGQDSVGQVKVRHNSTFNPLTVKGQLGLNANVVYQDFMAKMKSLANTSVSQEQAKSVVEALLAKSTKIPSESRGYKLILDLFNGGAKGANMDGVRGTAWGLLNAVTEYADFHIRASTQDNRLNSAWFGAGANLKENAAGILLEV
jgi:phage/plasmid-like protein (TIGR03299 family)